ncbi:MAG TPA: hypothetical protein EYH32_10850 [Anaerolineae bacterium]|nr:hypothetical protein [Anaerolineae bacterium]
MIEAVVRGAFLLARDRGEISESSELVAPWEAAAALRAAYWDRADLQDARPDEAKGLPPVVISLRVRAGGVESQAEVEVSAEAVVWAMRTEAHRMYRSAEEDHR